MRRARGSFFIGITVLVACVVAAPATALAKRPAEREDPYEELDRTSPRPRIDKKKPERSAPPHRRSERGKGDCVCGEPDSGAEDDEEDEGDNEDGEDEDVDQHRTGGDDHSSDNDEDDEDDDEDDDDDEEDDDEDDEDEDDEEDEDDDEGSNCDDDD